MKPFRIRVELKAHFDYMLPPETTAERVHREQSQAWLDARIHELDREVAARVENMINEKMSETSERRRPPDAGMK